MNQIKFGKLDTSPPKSRTQTLAEADNSRFTTWALAGLLIGFLAAAIECL